MNSRAVSVTIALVSLLGVSGVAWWSFQQRTSPGPLHASHANVKELQGNRGCDACHGAGEVVARASMAGACNACHTPIAEQVANSFGLHSTLEASLRDACEICHHEHLGDSAPLVSNAAFRTAGVTEVAAYDHGHIGGLTLEGKHASLACAQCHPKADEPMLRPGDRRYLGLTQACARCHEDVHKGELGNDCARCHGQEAPFKQSPLFAHPETFPLTAGHSGRSCSECHPTTMVYTGLSLDCVSCHTDTFEQTSKPSHTVAGLGKDCASCHHTQTWAAATYTHSAGFPLVGAHAHSACATCHSPGAPQGQVARFRSAPSCVACHGSPHDPMMIEAAERKTKKGSDACVVCHDPSDMVWRDGVGRMTPDLHASTGFPLVRPHATQACVRCHSSFAVASAELESPAAWRTEFPGRPPESCEKCHADPHQGQFAQGPSRGECLHCHERTAFFPTVFGVEMHAECAFPLDGSHRAVACASCHKATNGVRRFVGVPSGCGECHQDVHAGKFDLPSLPATVADKIGCARCHATDDFRRVAWSSEDHAVWTGEALTGRHASATCAACHRRDQARAGTFAGFEPAPKACAVCHEDVHAGQFRVKDGTDCARCHTSTESFTQTGFDHQRDSRFKLDSDHAALACTACHRPVEVSGTSIVRYKPLGMKCADCHGTRGGPEKLGGSSK